MRKQAFLRFCEEFEREANALLKAKGADYDAGEADQHASFRVCDGVDPRVVLVSHLGKQFRAVCKAASSPTRELTQSVRERFLDIRNYALLGAALFEEESEERSFSTQYNLSWKGYRE